MPLVARRKVRESWREAVVRRGAETARAEEAGARFDALRAAGRTEAEAAFATLREIGALDEVDLPGFRSAPIPP